MECGGALCLHSPVWSGTDFGKKQGGGFLKVSLRRDAEFKKNVFFRKVGFGDPKSSCSRIKVSCCSDNKSGALDEDDLFAISEENLILKREAEKVIPYLSGQCVYLVGMMGSGKTTVGKILSEALGYSFLDSDKLVELSVGATSVAQIFVEYGEVFFRENESKVLKDLSTMRRFVVATGGGAVIRPTNWRYMKKGITVWLDVPLEALARRIASVGTASRPLLHQESGDAYTMALKRLTTLFEERGDAYANADARVSLERIAGNKQNVNSLTPMVIAIEALVQLRNHFVANQLEDIYISRDGT